MADPLATRSYYSILSGSFAAKTSVLALLEAAYAALSTPQTISDFACSELKLQSIGANTKTILVGDANISTSIYGGVIAISGLRTYGPYNGIAPIPLANIYLMADDGATGVKIAIEAIPV